MKNPLAVSFDVLRALKSPVEKRQWTGAVQDAAAFPQVCRTARSVLDCGGPPPLFVQAWNVRNH